MSYSAPKSKQILLFPSNQEARVDIPPDTNGFSLSSGFATMSGVSPDIYYIGIHYYSNSTTHSTLALSDSTLLMLQPFFIPPSNTSIWYHSIADTQYVTPINPLYTTITFAIYNNVNVLAVSPLFTNLIEALITWY